LREVKSVVILILITLLRGVCSTWTLVITYRAGVLMTPFTFFCQSKLIFSDETCPTKKPDYRFIGLPWQTALGLSFRVIKTIPKKIALFGAARV
jgi:hypothetical protein